MGAPSRSEHDGCAKPVTNSSQASDAEKERYKSVQVFDRPYGIRVTKREDHRSEPLSQQLKKSDNRLTGPSAKAHYKSLQPCSP